MSCQFDGSCPDCRVDENFIWRAMEKVERFEAMRRHPSAINKPLESLLETAAGWGKSNVGA